MARPEKFQDSFILAAHAACKMGATDAEVAEILGVTVRTIHNWKATKPEFCEAMKVAKEVADDRVVRSLYHRAIGYEQEEVKIFMPAGAEKPVYAPFIAKIAPDTTAAIFWLKNRRPEEWRDRHDHTHGNPDGSALQIVVKKFAPDAD